MGAEDDTIIYNNDAPQNQSFHAWSQTAAPPAQNMASGRKRIMPGNATRMAIVIRSTTKNHEIPRKMVSSGICGATPFATYTLRPTGGVMAATSIILMTMMPYQIGE